MTKKTLISLFSGAGGMDLGFKNAGYNILWANDFEKDAVVTYKNNISKNIVFGDITKIESCDIPGKPGKIDVVIGGFPCQGFSIANIKRSMEDSRNFLYLELLRVIKDKKPKFFVAENVKGLLSMQHGEVLEMILQDFRELGYNVDYQILNAADYGVPQSRERVIIIGNRLGISNPFPQKEYGYQEPNLFNNNSYELKPYETVKKAIGFLANSELVNGKKKDFIIVNNRKIYNHIASTKVADSFYGRKYDVNQIEVCDYLKYWRDKSGWTTKKIDDYFGYKYTAGHWFRKDNKSGSLPKPEDWWELKKILKFDNKYDKAITTYIKKPILFEQSLRITNA